MGICVAIQILPTLDKQSTELQTCDNGSRCALYGDAIKPASEWFCQIANESDIGGIRIMVNRTTLWTAPPHGKR